MNQKQKKFIASLAIASLVLAVVGYYPGVNSAQAVNSLTAAKALLSESAPGTAATTTITFTTATSTDATGYFEVVMPAGFGDVVVGNITCSTGVASAFNTETIRCTGVQAVGAKTITLANTTNPTATTSQVINIAHYDVAGNLAERVQVVVQIIDNVWMTARVDATLNFIIAGINANNTVNGVTCTGTSTATTVPFGTLVPTASSTVCQELKVTTNSSAGFVVTVEQDDEMTSDGGDNINSFKDAIDGAGLAVAETWISPATVLDNNWTYGHMGLTSDDVDVVGMDYTGAKYAGLVGSSVMNVMTHNGPADGSTQSKGRAAVAYTAEINALQQAGDYENTLTYIATPTY